MKRGWLATIIGCGTLLVLIVIFGVTSVRQATRIYSELSANDSTMQTLEIQLGGLRADIYLFGIYIRDELLDSQAKQAPDHRPELHSVHDGIQRRLNDIQQLVPSEQTREINHLRDEIEGYWQSVSPVTEATATPSADAFQGVREQLIAKHDSSIAIAEEIARVSRESYGERHARIQAAQGAFLKYIWTMMAFTVALGILVFVASGYTVIAVNRRAESERKRVETAEHELRRLSSELLAAQEQERKILSRELHDEVGQTLTALGMEIGNIEALQPITNAELQPHIDEARRLTQETLKTVRTLAMGLRPAMLDDSGLAPAVRYQAREFSRRSGIPVTVDIDGEFTELSEPQRTCVYRVVQEALTNCARHSQATQVRIVLADKSGRISVKIEDDGIGFTKSATSTGLGLVGISERARELHGRMDINSNPGRGTVLMVELPVNTAVEV